MDEVFPVLAGVVTGLGTHLLVPTRSRAWVLAILSIAFGTTASWISGELAVSWFYLVIDIGQVVLAGALTWVLTARWLSRPWRVR